MKTLPTLLLPAIASLLATMCSAQTLDGAAVIAPGAKLEKLAGDFSFTEGPTADKDGNVFFTDQPNNRIMKWSVDGKLSTFLQPAGRANGMFFDATGKLIACADEKAELWSIRPDGRRLTSVAATSRAACWSDSLSWTPVGPSTRNSRCASSRWISASVLSYS